jgi:hypothetical protein
MDSRNLWQLIREAWSKLESRYGAAINVMVSESGMDMREWMILIAVLTFEPEDATPSHFMVRGPYTSSDRYLSRLGTAADQGYLEQINPGRFRLSAQGREATAEFIRIARDSMASVDPLSSSKSQMYRDDAHLAAWQSSGLSAIALESLTMIWRGQVGTLDELTDKLYFRGHPQSVYIDALNELRARSYISGFRNALRITNQGCHFRDQVEMKTEEYFFAPWDCLSGADMEKMADLLTEMRDGLNSS